MRLFGTAVVLTAMVAFAGCGGGNQGASSQYEKVDANVDLANAVRSDIAEMKNSEGGPAGGAAAFVENMESRVNEAPADSKATYEQILAKAKELNSLVESKADKAKLDAVVKELEDLAAQLPGGGQ